MWEHLKVRWRLFLGKQTTSQPVRSFIGTRLDVCGAALVQCARAAAALSSFAQARQPHTSKRRRTRSRAAVDTAALLDRCPVDSCVVCGWASLLTSWRKQRRTDTRILHNNKTETCPPSGGKACWPHTVTLWATLCVSFYARRLEFSCHPFDWLCSWSSTLGHALSPSFMVRVSLLPTFTSLMLIYNLFIWLTIIPV